MSRRSLKRKQGGFILAIAMAVIALFVALTVHGNEGRAKKAELQARYSELQKVKESRQEQKEDLKDEAEYMESLDYIEEMAREKFGLVYEDEVIFREKDD